MFQVAMGWEGIHLYQFCLRSGQVWRMLQLKAPLTLDPHVQVAPPLERPDAQPVSPAEPPVCPYCHQGRLIFIRTLKSGQAMGP